MISATSPILQHLLVNRDEALFSDEVIARVRGITANIAFQLLVARAVEAVESDPAVAAISGQDAVARSLIEDEVFVAHIHALTLEAQLAESIRQRSGVDHVLSLLIQHLTASPDEKTAALAIRTIAAQARFIQQMRRMEMPLNEKGPAKRRGLSLKFSALLSINACLSARSRAASGRYRAGAGDR